MCVYVYVFIYFWHTSHLQFFSVWGMRSLSSRWALKGGCVLPTSLHGVTFQKTWVFKFKFFQIKPLGTLKSVICLEKLLQSKSLNISVEPFTSWHVEKRILYQQFMLYGYFTVCCILLISVHISRCSGTLHYWILNLEQIQYSSRLEYLMTNKSASNSYDCVCVTSNQWPYMCLILVCILNSCLEMEYKCRL